MKKEKIMFGLFLVIVASLLLTFLSVKTNPLVHTPLNKPPSLSSLELKIPRIVWETETINANYRHVLSKSRWVFGKSSYYIFISRKNTNVSSEKLYNEIKENMKKYA